jgi:hypothetical protein
MIAKGWGKKDVFKVECIHKDEGFKLNCQCRIGAELPPTDGSWFNVFTIASTILKK